MYNRSFLKFCQQSIKYRSLDLDEISQRPVLSLFYITLMSASEKARLLCRESGTSFLPSRRIIHLPFTVVFSRLKFSLQPFTMQSKAHIGNGVKSVINIPKCVLSKYTFFPPNNGFEAGLKLILQVLTRHLCFPFPVSDSTDCVGGGSGFWHLLAAASRDSSLG